MQLPLTPLQGQTDYVVIPFDLTYLKANSMFPPKHPLFPYDEEQSISCCSEKDWRLLQLILLNPSKAPVAEKAQHPPQFPWFLTGVTAPHADQSNSPISMNFSSTGFFGAVTLVPRQISMNSCFVRQVNWLIPMVQVCWLSVL